MTFVNHCIVRCFLSVNPKVMDSYETLFVYINGSVGKSMSGLFIDLAWILNGLRDKCSVSTPNPFQCS